MSQGEGQGTNSGAVLQTQGKAVFLRPGHFGEAMCGNRKVKSLKPQRICPPLIPSSANKEPVTLKYDPEIKRKGLSTTKDMEKLSELISK